MENGFQCIDEDDNTCEFPANWNQGQEGVYRLKYKIKTGKYDGKIIQFRFVDLGEELSVSFVVEDSEILNSVQLKCKATIDQNIKIYE